MFGGITIADLRKGHISKRRNSLIADLFRRIEMVEAWGRGMPLILEHEPDVEFKEIAGIFVAAFDRPSFRDGFREEHSPAGQAQGEKVGERVGEKLTDNQQRILTVLSEAPHASAKKLAEEVGISVRKIEVNLRKLRERKLLKRVGPAKGGHWEVLK